MTDAPVVVIGGGITGLAAAHLLASRHGPGSVTLIEAARRLGGKISTEVVDGFVIEGGPDCFLAAKPAGVELCGRLGLRGSLITSSEAWRRSFVRKEGRLHELPAGLSGLVPSRLGPLLRTRLLSPLGRARAALELLVPRRRDTGDESIASFARRRFGDEAWNWIIEPLLGGIYAGNGEALSIAATFPKLAEMERRDGPLLRKLLAPRAAPSGAAGLAGFVTPRGGLAELVVSLEAALAGSLHVGRRVLAIGRDEGSWRVTLDGGETLAARVVVLAVPAHVAQSLIRAVDETLAGELAAIPFVSTATISAAFLPGAIARPLAGHGWVSPRAAGGAVVACTWTSNKFPERAPSGATLVRLFVGRAGNDQPARGDDETLRELARRELAQVHDITVEPAFWRIQRWPDGMPQYVVGHGERLERIERKLAALPGLLLAGASYRGVGLPDCIASGWNAAEAAAASAGLAA